jgi:hypothetical protein
MILCFLLSISWAKYTTRPCISFLPHTNIGIVHCPVTEPMVGLTHFLGLNLYLLLPASLSTFHYGSQLLSVILFSFLFGEIPPQPMTPNYERGSCPTSTELSLTTTLECCSRAQHVFSFSPTWPSVPILVHRDVYFIFFQPCLTDVILSVALMCLDQRRCIQV